MTELGRSDYGSRNMRIVVLETSGWCGELALADERHILVARRLSAARKHARDLVPTLKAMLQELGWPPKSIDLIVVGLGPGSYTGLRVGVMTAKTMAFASGSAIIGVDSMDTLAEPAPIDAERVDPIVDAQQGLVYAAEYRRTAPGEPLSLARSTTIVSAPEWAGRLVPGTYVTGPALVRYASLVPATCRVASESERDPSAGACWRVGLRRFQAGERDDFWTIEPHYLRPSAAEQKWAARHPQEPRSPGL
jgi:tRNA threonylcarbamoyladenosine biosynthesis protein TsaB